MVGEEAQRTQSALEAGAQGGRNEPAELNAANLLGDFKASGVTWTRVVSLLVDAKF